MGGRPSGRSHPPDWGGRRQDDETDRVFRATHSRIDGLKLPAHLVFTITGTVLKMDDQCLRFTPPADLYLTKVRLAVPDGDEPTGQALIVDIRIGGDSIFTPEGKPRIKPSEETGESRQLAIDTIRSGEWPIIDVDQVGIAAAGDNLSVMIEGYTVPLEN